MLWKQALRNISIVIIVSSSMVNAGFILRWERNVSGSRGCGTWRETLWWYFIYIIQGKRQFVAKVSPSKMYRTVLFFFISWGSSTEEQKPEKVVVEEVNPEYSSCGKVLASQACLWYWEKTQQTNKKEKQEAARGRRKPMAIDGEAPKLPEVAEGALASSEASCWDTFLWQKG